VLLLQITLGTEVTGNLLSKEAQCAVGYQFDLRQNAVRGQVNNRGVIIGILENKLAPGLSFTITGQLNHFTGLSVFGIGFTLGV
jgi:mitochondrial import receptor subunit TOM40